MRLVHCRIGHVSIHEVQLAGNALGFVGYVAEVICECVPLTLRQASVTVPQASERDCAQKNGMQNYPPNAPYAERRHQ